MGEIFRLNNQIQNYAWGSHTVLARMRGLEFPTTQPEAELWVGAHPAASSMVDLGSATVALADMVAAEPQRVLPAQRSAHWFPFLLKILAIDAPLSIQVHPDRQSAAAGFAAEEEAGISSDDPTRTYRDPYSKPETVIALEPMQILTGVRPPDQLAELAAALDLPWLRKLLPQRGARELLTAIIRMSDTAAEEATRITVERAAALRPTLEKDSVSARVADMIAVIAGKHPGDRGLLVAVTMNLLSLAPGDSVFTPDGQVHAYLSGTAVEIMNPSDNVLRAGLTPKHVDSEELVRVLREDQPSPRIQRASPDEGPLGVFFTWDERLTVTRLRLTGESCRITLQGTAAVLGVAGSMSFQAGTECYSLAPTESLLHAGEPTAVTVTGTGEAYIAAYI